MLIAYILVVPTAAGISTALLWPLLGAAALLTAPIVASATALALAVVFASGAVLEEEMLNLDEHIGALKGLLDGARPNGPSACRRAATRLPGNTSKSPRNITRRVVLLPLQQPAR
jgi:hypothetical protein